MQVISLEKPASLPICSIFKDQSYSAWVTESKEGRNKPANRIWFDDDLQKLSLMTTLGQSDDTLYT